MTMSEIYRCDVVLTGEGRVTLALAGELDSSNAARFGAAVEDATLLELTVLIVDAARVDFCGAAAIRYFDEAARRCAKRGIAFRVEHPPPIMRRLFDLTGLDSLHSFADELSSRSSKLRDCR